MHPPKKLIINAQLQPELLPLSFLSADTMQLLEPKALGLTVEAMEKAQSWHREFSKAQFATVDKAHESAYYFWKNFRHSLTGNPDLILLLPTGMGQVSVP